MIVVLALLLLGPPRAEHRPEAERLFQLGLDLVAEGDTTGALAAWDGAAATEWTSAALEYNRGTVALARGDLGTARLALERAARLAPRDARIATALAEVREATGDAAPSAISSLARAGLARIGLLGLVGLTLTLYALGLVVGLRWWRQRTRPLALATLVLASAFVLSLGGALAGLADASSARGVALDASVVRTAPSPTATETERLREGTVLRLGETRGDWQAVTVGDADGWVPKALVESI